MNDKIIEFNLDETGKCNFCLDWEKKKSLYLNFTKLEENTNLENLKNKLKKSNSNYDCIVGLSGGTDSSFVIYKLWKMGVNPLVIHMDNGWNSSISNLNISKILNFTKFDYETLILNWKEFKDLQKSFLKADVPDIELVTDHAIFAYIINLALKKKN